MTTLSLDFAVPTATPPAWECAQTDRPRYLRWVWEVSHLPFPFVALGACRDAYRLKLARSWKTRVEQWCNKQHDLEMTGNPHAWNLNAPNMDRFLSHYGATDEDVDEGTALLYELGFLGISDEWRTDMEARP